MFRSVPLGHGRFWSGTWEYLWHSLLGITRLGRLVAWSGDLGTHGYQELLVLLFCPRGIKFHLIVPLGTEKLIKERARLPDMAV